MAYSHSCSDRQLVLLTANLGPEIVVTDDSTSTNEQDEDEYF